MILRSRYLIDSFGRIIENAEIAVHETRIASIHRKDPERTVSDADVIDLGNAALLPGFVNTHAHLELTSAHSSIKRQFRFTDWIRDVVRETGSWTEDAFESSLQYGIKLCTDSGTSSLGDIGRMTKNLSAYHESGIRMCLFHEVIGFDPHAAQEIFDALKVRLGKYAPDNRLRLGIAPHTPYTVSEPLLRKCIKLAHDNSWPLCIHLGETTAELEFLRAGTGEIRHFREEFGMPPQWTPPGVSPVHYLHYLGFFEKPAVLIHCNYVPEEDFDIIALSGSSVVYCPRSHQYFGHLEHPFLKMLGHGINVALGTDSLISSPTLSILDEMKFVRQEFPELSPARILQMATTNGLKALGISPDVGPLESGCKADLVGVRLSEEDIQGAGSPMDAIFSKHSDVIFSMVGGRVLKHISHPDT